MFNVYMKYLYIETYGYAMYVAICFLLACMVSPVLAQEVISVADETVTEMSQDLSSSSEVHKGLKDILCDASKEDCSTPVSISVCTAEAKVCADGSTVGRTGPQCTFAACPEEVEGFVGESHEQVDEGPVPQADKEVPVVMEEVEVIDEIQQAKGRTSPTLFQKILKFFTIWF